MVRKRKLVWQFSAQRDIKEIFRYWNKSNKSNLYSRKLNSLFQLKTKFLKDFPNIGFQTNIPNVRVVIVEKYLIVYDILETEILIARIFDGRDNPEKLEI